MSFLREIEKRQAEIAGLRALVLDMPEDPLAKPLMISRLESLENELKELEKKTSIQARG